MDALRWSSWRGWADLVVLVAVLVTFWDLGGLFGAFGWLLVVAAWAVVPRTVAFVIGQFVLVVLAPPDLSLTAVAPGAAALIALLLIDFRSESRPLFSTVVFLGFAALLGVVTGGLARSVGLLAAAGTLLAAVGLLAYLLHRYSLLPVESASTTTEP